MSTSFTRTRRQLADMVLRKCGTLGIGQTPVSADLEMVFESIDYTLKEMHREGIFWRKVDKTPAEFSASAGTISAHVGSSDILFPITMTIVNGSVDEHVDIIGVQEYAAIYDKEQQGLPRKALWRGSDEFFFWPVPVSATTAKLTYERIADDTSHGAAPDVEVSMLRALRDIVCYRVGDDLAVSDAKMVRFMGEAKQAEKDIRKLSAQRIDLTDVAVDEWGERNARTETDYGA